MAFPPPRDIRPDDPAVVFAFRPTHRPRKGGRRHWLFDIWIVAESTWTGRLTYPSALTVLTERVGLVDTHAEGKIIAARRRAEEYTPRTWDPNRQDG